MRSSIVRCCLPLLIAAALAVPALAQHAPPPPAAAAPAGEEFKNLKVLPKDIPPAELRALMNSFTRALGVRCIYCHVGEEGKPFRHEDFQLDDKGTKLKAREMLRMVRDINDKYLAALDHRADPPIRVECVTCHRGSTQPRMLQSVLKSVYDAGGIDSTLARYRALRSRYYGGFTYDFGEVPLADLGGTLLDAGHAADAESLLAFNVTMNPSSTFAKRQSAIASIVGAFRGGAAPGPGIVRDLRARYGEALVSEQMINGIGYDLLGRHEQPAALAAFRQNVADYPASANAYDSLGEALLQSGDAKRAKEAYARSLELDPANDHAKHQFEAIKHPPKGKARSASRITP